MDLYGDLPAAKSDGSAQKNKGVDIFASSSQSGGASQMMAPPPFSALKKPAIGGMVPLNALKKKATIVMPPPSMAGSRPKPSAATLPPPGPSAFSDDSWAAPPPKATTPLNLPPPEPMQEDFILQTPEDTASKQNPASSQNSSSMTSLHSDEVSDPYDPARPNDYTVYCKERIAKKKEDERQRELQKYIEQQEKERLKLEEARRLAAEGLGPFNMGAAAVPSGRGRAGRGRGVSNLPAWMSKKQEDEARPTGQPGQFADEGVSKPPPEYPRPPGGAAAPKPKKKGLFSNPTKVVLLKNMVGPGEVDEDLAVETKEECGKYGPVKECVVFEVTQDVAIEEKVRTFVAFERQDSAIKAFMDMNGRFFAGRQITAVFYKEDKFDKRDLDYTPGEGS